MRNASYFIVLALAGPAFAQPVSQLAWMTGEKLLKKLDPVNPRDVPWTPQSGVSRDELAAMHTHSNIEYARGYIEALHDATEGKDWCYDTKHQTPNPGGFWDESRWGLFHLSDAQKKRSAAELLPEIWRAKWPCPSGQRGKP
jgi:hypothetical protein